MITGLEVKQNENNTTRLKYTATFDGTSSSCYGELDATAEETTEAFKGITSTDMWAGFRKLVLQRLKDEATNALSNG